MRARTAFHSAFVAFLIAGCQVQPQAGTDRNTSKSGDNIPKEHEAPAEAPAPSPPPLESSALSQSCNTSPSGEQCMLIINGEITHGLERHTAEAAEKIRSANGRIYALTLSSNGGDLREALKLGQLARSLE